METLLLNGHNLNVQGVKELKTGLSIQEAAQKTKKNGIDEVYFTVNGKNYLAYGDALQIGELSQNKIATVTYQGQTGNVVAYENEINSVGEGLKTGALAGFKKAKDAVFGAVSNTITSIGPTSTLAVGGAIGITGLALWRGVAINSASSPIGNILGDLLKNGSIGALKVITVAGALGFGIAAVAGAVGGASEASSAEKDYSTIASVTKDGNMSGGVQVQDSGSVQPPVQQQMLFSRPNVAPVDFGSISTFLSSR